MKSDSRQPRAEQIARRSLTVEERPPRLFCRKLLDWRDGGEMDIDRKIDALRARCVELGASDTKDGRLRGDPVLTQLLHEVLDECLRHTAPERPLISSEPIKQALLQTLGGDISNVLAMIDDTSQLAEFLCEIVEETGQPPSGPAEQGQEIADLVASLKTHRGEHTNPLARKLFPEMVRKARGICHRRRFPDADNLAHAAAVAVWLKGFENWNPERGMSFNNYLSMRLVSELIDELRTTNRPTDPLANREYGSTSDDGEYMSALGRQADMGARAQLSLIREKQLNARKNAILLEFGEKMLGQSVQCKIDGKEKAVTINENHVKIFREYFQCQMDLEEEKEVSFRKFALRYNYNEDTARRHLTAVWAFWKKHPDGQLLADLCRPIGRQPLDTSYS